ncbi:MAG: homoserine O-succinyltransferase [Gammaproteobacteria bacterium]|nr:homoserine O-succinyltransferase [Gammaproteobacteria bacterium]
MPLIAHSDLPTYARLQQEGETVLSPDRAAHQDIRELHIGLLNMMPDAALAATERQFFRLVSESNQIAQFYLHPFSIDALQRSTEAAAYIEKYYESFEQLKQDGLDALIITGANVTQPNLSAEPFWEPLIEIIDWAYNNVTSTICSCLATHAVLEFLHGQKRRRLPAKRWGVFHHQVEDRQHPLVNGVNTLFDAPHSRFNDVSKAQFETAGLHVLAESKEAGVHLAVSSDQFRIVYFQGHPEYDINSLLKEYKREVSRFIDNECDQYPPFPDHYFNLQVQAIADEHKDLVLTAKKNNEPTPEFPETLITTILNNTWHDTAEAIINNWIGKVYQITNSARTLPFMDGIDSGDPLGLKVSAQK